MTNPLTELKDTVEAVRTEQFPSLPAELVSEILQIEAECVEARPEALRRVEAAIQASVARQGS
jgi:hypothetical protein